MKKKKDCLWRMLSLAAVATLSLVFSSCKKDKEDIVEPSYEISVSPTTASLLGEKNSSTTININTEGDWTLNGCPDWLHTSAKSGNGKTSVTLTALNENWSDEDRNATLIVNTSTHSAQVQVSQRGTLPQGLRVEMSNITLMSDGFASDLTFGSAAKGYREAFFLESQLPSLTDHDIFDSLMTKHEYGSLIDYTYLPGKVNPNTKLVYCIAAYGNETNADGSHKYGPVTIKRITTRAKTLYDDMVLSKTYNSSQWTVVAARQGQYGQMCDDFYYLAAEGNDAYDYCIYYLIYTDAFIAHYALKPSIENDKTKYFCRGPQTLTFSRSSDVFFCTTWGIDRDTQNFSAELSNATYYDLSSSETKEFLRAKSNPEDWNKEHWHPTKEEIQKMQNAIHVLKITK